MTWILSLGQPSSDPLTTVGGLPLALRLALDAQASGAAGIVLEPGSERARPALADPRLHLPVFPSAPEGIPRVRVPASWVVHRGLFRQLRAEDAGRDPSNERDLSREPFTYDAPWGFAPIDVTDKASRRAAERALFRSLRKPQDGWTSRWLNRYISLSISRLLIRTPLRPNQLSVGILGVGLLGAYLASRGSYSSLLGGALLFQAQSVLDGCDGEISRITHRGSRLGEWLDTIGDDLTNYGFFAGAAGGLHRVSGSPWYLVAGAVTLVCGLLASGLEYRYLIKIGSGDLLRYPLSQGQGTGAFAKIAPLFKRDTFVLLTLIAAALDVLGPMLVVFAAGALGVCIGVLQTELRLAREARGARA